MITEYIENKPDIRGLLLLDCWEPQVYEHLYKEKYYINLIECIGNKNYECIVNSATGLKIELNDPSMANTLKVCKYSDTHPLIRNLLQHSGDMQTSNLLLKYLIRRQYTVNILTFEDFVWFSTKYLNKNIQNWLIVGHTWQMCTHWHSLGLPKLAHLSFTHNLNFYATDYSFCTMTEKTAGFQDFEQDLLNWRLVKDFGYQLLPQEFADKY